MASTQNWYKDWWKLERFDHDSSKQIVKLPNMDKNSHDSIPEGENMTNIQRESDRIPMEEGMEELNDDDAPDSDTNTTSDSKHMLLQELRRNGGDVTTPSFHLYLSKLSKAYKYKPNTTTNPNSGFWATLSKPNFKESLGRHPESGEYRYTLGRMSFDMFPRGDLICSVRGSFNIVTKIEDDLDKEGLIVPKCLKKEDLEGIMTYK